MQFLFSFQQYFFPKIYFKTKLTQKLFRINTTYGIH